MAMDVKEMLTRQRKRATGSVLGYVEAQPWYKSLSTEQKNALREKVLSSMSAYHDVISDVVSTLDGDGGIYNGRALELLEEIHGLVSPARERPLAVADGRSG